MRFSVALPPSARRPSTRNPSLYVSHPKNTFGSEHKTRMLALIREAFPGADLYDPADHPRPNGEWRDSILLALTRFDGLVAFPGPDGLAGLGVKTEISNAALLGLPVWAFDPGTGRFRVPSGYVTAPGGDPDRFAEVVFDAAAERDGRKVHPFYFGLPLRPPSAWLRPHAPSSGGERSGHAPPLAEPFLYAVDPAIGGEAT